MAKKAKIHHTQKAQAANVGIELREKGELVEAFWPERGATALGATASEALEKMKAIQTQAWENDTIEEEPADDVEEQDQDEDAAVPQDDDADGEEGEEEEEKVSSSVVKEKYRAIYAERGHPAHCGDWLATVLNNLVLTKEGADIERFRQICELNDVDMSKYKTTGNGWQGRYRMTGRNLLAKVLQEREVLLAPGMNGEVEEYRVPDYWKEERKPVK